MIDGLVSGKLCGMAQERTGKSGKTFVTAKVRAAVSNESASFVSVITFEDKVKSALLALGDGDSVALAGTLTPKVWTNKEGNARASLEMMAHGVLTAYEVKRRRAAVQANHHQSGKQCYPMNGMEQARRMYGDMNDEL